MKLSSKGYIHIVLILAVLSLLGFFLYTSAIKRDNQTFAETSPFIRIGGSPNLDSSDSVRQTTDGGYITVGTTFGVGTGNDLLFTKFDQSGKVSWSKSYRGTKTDIGYKVEPASDGGFAMLGTTGSFGDDGQTLLVKFGSDGEPAWAKTTGGNFSLPRDFRLTSDGGYILTGEMNGQGAWSFLSLTKYDDYGSVVWSKAVGDSTKPIAGESVEQTSDGGYIVTGRYGGITTPSTGDWDIILAKFDSNGNSTWVKTFGGSNDETGLSVKETNDGYVVSGWSKSFGSDGQHLLFTKFDKSGNTMWSRNIGDATNADSGQEVEVVDDGYIVIGTAPGLNGGNNLSIIKLDILGNLVWAKRFTKDSTNGNSISKTSDGGFIIAGYHPASNGDAMVIKTDSQGEVSSCADFTTFSPSLNDVTLNVNDKTLITSEPPLTVKRQQLQRLSEPFNFNLSYQCPAQSASPSPSQKPGRKPTK